AIGDQGLAVAHADRGGSPGRQPSGGFQYSGGSHILQERHPGVLSSLLFLGGVWLSTLAGVHQQHVFHGLVLLWNKAECTDLSGSQSSWRRRSPEVRQTPGTDPLKLFCERPD